MILRPLPLPGAFFFLILIMAIFLPHHTAQASSEDQSAEKTPRDFFRLHKSFAEDAAIPEKAWFGGGMDSQNWDVKLGKWQNFLGGGIMEIRPMENLAVGVRYLMGHVYPEDFHELAADFGGPLPLTFSTDYKDEFAFTDVDLWLKYRFRLSDELQVTPGVLVSIPCGSTKIPGQSAWDCQIFGSARYDHEYMTVVGHLGAKMYGNFDMSFKLRNPGYDDIKMEGIIEGNPTFLCGVGLIIPCSNKFSLITELNFETPRYEDSHEFLQLMFGPEIRFWGHRTFRAAFGVNLSRLGGPYSELMIGGGANF